MRMKNVGSVSIKLHKVGLGVGEVEAGATVELPDHVCRPHRTAGGGRGPSLVEDLCGPNLVPDDADEHAEWIGVPAAPKPAPRLPGVATVENIMRERRVSRGVAELLVAEQASRAAGVDLEAALDVHLSPVRTQLDTLRDQLHEGAARERALQGQLDAVTARERSLQEQLDALRAQPAPQPSAPAAQPEQPAAKKPGKP